MAGVKARNTRPELLVRRLVHRMGYRYRLHVRRLPGTPDLVFPGRRKVVFVHGCFWHLHEGCSNYRAPRSRLDFWLPKLRANRDHDAAVRDRLRELGWDVLTIWECELGDEALLSARIKSFLEDLDGETSGR